MNTFPLLRASSDQRRWLALMVVCLAQLMIVLDTTIVNVALPSIQRDLHFTQGNLTWVINAFLIAFGSFLLLAGRLGDLFGRKRIFLIGVVTFTVASALCGFASSQGLLIAARFVQGIGGALSASVILAIIVTEFPLAEDRAKAMSAYVFVAVAGGSLGLLAGGALTQALNWHWIFFVNLPIGVATFGLGRALLPGDKAVAARQRIDWLGSLLVTLSLMTAVYAIVQATSFGWGSVQVLGFGALAGALMAAFLALEARIANPIVPLRILRLRGLVGSSAVRLPGHRDVLDLLPRHPLSRARAPLQRPADGSRVPPLDRDRRHPLARHHGADDRPLRGHTRAAVRSRDGDRRSRAARNRRPEHPILPHDLLCLLRDRTGDRQLVHAAFDNRDGQRPGR
jgi:MFS family permease